VVPSNENGSGLEYSLGDWEPGSEVTWIGLGEKTPLKVFVPEDYAAERAWPLIYIFHGTGGRASTSMMQRYTKRRGFILVGAPFAIPGEGSLSRQGVLGEMRRIGQMRTLLGQSLSLDQRTYVGGFSKGGWMSDLLATEGFPTLTGALILGAGRIPEDVGRVLDREKKQPSAVNPIYIYIGIGQLDTNHLYSRRAAAHYRERKHPVVFEEYLAKGHRPGAPDAIYLSQWLHLQIANKATISTEAHTWWETMLNRAESITPPIERVLFLETMHAAPFAALVAPEKRTELAKKLERVKRHRMLITEMEARRAYQNAQTEEEAFRRSKKLPKVAASFARVHERFPKTFFGQRAGLDLIRVSKNYRTLQRAVGEAKAAEFPLPKNQEALEERFAQFDRKLRQEGR
jgi:predicted esterase